MNNEKVGSILYCEYQNEIYILLLSIDDKHQRKGYGTQVVDFFKTKGKTIRINIEAGEVGAVAFWTAQGFQPEQQNDLRIGNVVDYGYVFFPNL